MNVMRLITLEFIIRLLVWLIFQRYIAVWWSEFVKIHTLHGQSTKASKYFITFCLGYQQHIQHSLFLAKREVYFHIRRHEI